MFRYDVYFAAMYSRGGERRKSFPERLSYKTSRRLASSLSRFFFCRGTFLIMQFTISQQNNGTLLVIIHLRSWAWSNFYRFNGIIEFQLNFFPFSSRFTANLDNTRRRKDIPRKKKQKKWNKFDIFTTSDKWRKWKGNEIEKLFFLM